MGKYLKKFENHAAYEAAESGLILPNVSLCVQEGDVHYNPYVDPYVGHAYVEIGGLKWATMNVGATGITDTGLYFQWGDTQGYTASQVGSGEGQKYFGEDDYIYYNDGSYTKYNSNDGKTVLDIEDDAARANWGGSWRMPTTAEFQALGAAVNTAYTSDYKSSGIRGLICTAKDGSGAELFFPVTHYYRNGEEYPYASRYWASSIFGFEETDAYCLEFGSVGNAGWFKNGSRYMGCPVSGVLDD